jgi:hypothetical protein
MSKKYMGLCDDMYGTNSIIKLLNEIFPNVVSEIIKECRGLDACKFVINLSWHVQKRTRSNQSAFINVDTIACLCDMKNKNVFVDDYRDTGWYPTTDKDFKPTDKFQARIDTCGCKSRQYKIDTTLRRCRVINCQSPTAIASPNRFCKKCESMFSGLNGFDVYPEYVMGYTRLRRIWLNARRGLHGIGLFLKACVYALVKYVEASDDFNNNDCIQTKNSLVAKNIWYLEKMVVHLTVGEYKVDYVVYKLQEYIEWIRKSSHSETFDIVNFILTKYIQRC